MSADDEWAPAGIDTSVPSVARMYDFFIGGKDNFAADRAMAEQVLARVPETADALRANRRFLGRAVRFLAESGVDQFLDLGAGLPSQNNVHEVAQRVRPGAKVLYIDNDPIVLAHARALLAPDESTVVVQADMRDPDAILGHRDVRRLLDFSRPVAVMFVAVLHFVTDAEDPWSAVKALTSALAPGSYMTVSHSTFDGQSPEDIAAVQAQYANASAPAVFRGREDIGRFFNGFDLVEPGLVSPSQWRSDDVEKAMPGGGWMLSGVGRKP